MAAQAPSFEATFQLPWRKKGKGTHVFLLRTLPGNCTHFYPINQNVGTGHNKLQRRLGNVVLILNITKIESFITKEDVENNVDGHPAASPQNLSFTLGFGFQWLFSEASVATNVHVYGTLRPTLGFHACYLIWPLKPFQANMLLLLLWLLFGTDEKMEASPTSSRSQRLYKIGQGQESRSVQLPILGLLPIPQHMPS